MIVSWFRGGRWEVLRTVARRIRTPLVFLAGSIAFGTIGYSLIPGWSVWDAFFMSVITLTTVGYSTIHPLGVGGEIFTVVVLLVGLGAVFAMLATITELVVGEELSGRLRGLRMQRQIDRLSGHHIVCAYGRVGRAAAAQLIAAGEPVVLLETDERLREVLAGEGLPHLMADPSEEQVLIRAGVMRAKGLVCAVDSDAVNVYITLTARALNPALRIVARASRPESEPQLVRAGADRVVQPYALSGGHMAALALHPSVVDFFDVSRMGANLRIEEIQVTAGSSLDGQLIGEACSTSSQITALAVRRPSGEMLSPPSPTTRLAAGDLLLAFGHLDALAGIEA